MGNIRSWINLRVFVLLLAGAVFALSVSSAMGAAGLPRLIGQDAAIPVSAAVLDNPETDKTADRSFVGPEETLTYTITIANAGTGKATGVEVRDTIPPGTEFFPNSLQVDGKLADPQDPQAIKVPDIDPNDDVVITFQVRVSPQAQRERSPTRPSYRPPGSPSLTVAPPAP